jgi:hypothetical protein
MDPLALARALLAALLTIFPHAPARACLVARTDALAAALASAEASRGVPAGLMLAVAFRETWVGCHPHEGGNWGAPRPGANRHLAGTPDDAARAMARSYAVCGSWAGAVGRYRSGLCAPWNPVHRAYVAATLRLAARLYAAAGVAWSPGADRGTLARAP